MSVCQACVIQACDEHQRPPVCVCDTPRFDGPCNCQRTHVTGECFACHRPYKPEFAAIRDAWRRQLAEVA